MQSFHGQSVAVVGGSSGIGLELVRRLAGEGARVLAVGRDPAKLEAALQDIEGPVTGLSVDATDRAALDRLFAQNGAIDHLVLTLSGGEGAGLFAELDLAALRRGFEAKFWPQLQAAQAGLKALAKGGSITFVTAISARIARPGVSGLGAINGALEAMIGSLARELAPCRVNAVSPGVIETPWWDGWPVDAKQAFFEEQIRTLPVARVGRPEDVADTVMFLARNQFVTGVVVPCDGGLHLL
jgi:NAD(P)-dependent dehydrogenase (short-subunit alcohol dehydrogenase family)